MSISPATDHILTITSTEGIDDAVGQNLASQLGQVMEVSEPQTYWRRAADPQIQQFIQLIGSVETWQALKFAAYAVVAIAGTRLTQHITDDLWAAIKNRLKRDDTKPMEIAAASLSQAAHAMPDRTRIYIGIDVPEPNFGTVLEIAGRNPEEIAVQLAHFVLSVDEIHMEVAEAVAKGDGPLGQGTISLAVDGEVQVQWVAQSDFKPRIVVIRRRTAA